MDNCNWQFFNPHIEIDCHFIWQQTLFGETVTLFENSNVQLAKYFCQSLIGPRINYICNKNKPDAYDTYEPAWGGMLRLSLFPVI